MLEEIEKLPADKCRSCKYMTTNGGTHHIGCSKRNVLVSGSEHGIKNGWFEFPYNFDPIWLEECVSYRSKSFDLKSLSNQELLKLFFKETTIYSKVQELAAKNWMYKLLFIELSGRIKKETAEDLKFMHENISLFNSTEEVSDEFREKILSITEKFMKL